MRTLCACSPDQGDFQITQTKNNLDPVPLAFFYTDYDRLAFASQDEASRPGSTQEVRLLAERRVCGHYCSQLRDYSIVGVVVVVVVGLRLRTTTLSPLDQIANSLSTTAVR